MFVDVLKENCNYKYNKCIVAIENLGDPKDIHTLLLEVAQILEDIGKVSIPDKENAIKKAYHLLELAKTISRNNIDYRYLYKGLTGRDLVINKEKKDINEDDILKESRDLLNKAKDFLNSDGLNTDNDNKEDIKEKKEPKSENNDNEASKNPMRPQLLDDYIGQEKLKSIIKDCIYAAKLKNEPLEHTLLFGSAGLGKTSLARIIANEMNSDIIILSGPTLNNVESIVDIIKKVKYGDILFIDEIHSMPQIVAEALYTVMEDFELTYVEKVNKESNNKTITVPKFTVIGATTHSGLLTKPMRDRFSISLKLELYTVEELQQIVINSMKKLGLEITPDASLEIAKRSRGVPRVCNSFVSRIRDKAILKNIKEVDVDLVLDYFDLVNIDKEGLGDLEFRYLTLIYERYENRPTGLETISECLSEGKNIIESQIEPYLLYKGYIQKTPQGRIVTSLGIEYIENREKRGE